MPWYPGTQGTPAAKVGMLRRAREIRFSVHVPSMIFLDSLNIFVSFGKRNTRARDSTHLFDPIETMALEGGPMNTIPSWASRSANLAFSLRKP